MRIITLALMTIGLVVGNRSHGQDRGAEQAREYLQSILYTRSQVDRWLSGETIVFGETYDGELGWVVADRRTRDGVDGSIAEYRYAGARRMIMHADRPCRINTYGDSFTHCDQVSDGETWQEYLAAHLCEPVRNFGVGGYSVYQAYLRMLREETRTPAKYIIFNIYEDDHYRNLHGWRNLRTGYTPKTWPGVLSASLPYVCVNPATGEFTRFPNPCPNCESVYNLCDLDWVMKRFADDFVLKLVLAQQNLRAGTPEKSYAAIQQLATQHGMDVPVDSPQSLQRTTEALDTAAGLFATMRIIELVEQFASRHGKRVLYVLSFSGHGVARTLQSGKRFDQPFVDFMKEKGLPFVDLMEAHRRDFDQFQITPEQYVKRYWVGHYNPRGNFSQAFAIKDKLVELLDPRPLSYATDRPDYVDPATLRGDN